MDIQQVFMFRQYFHGHPVPGEEILMKEPFRFYLFAAAAMLAAPAAAVLTVPRPEQSGLISGVQRPSAAVSAAEVRQTVPAPAEAYRVLRTESGEIEEIPVRDYLIGAVAAEMPASYAPEALKAQAVVSHTYAERIRLQNQRCPDASLRGADFSDDSAHYQAFYSAEQMRLAGGAHFAENYDKIADAVDAVCNLLLYADGEPIVAAFHAVSAGKTEASENVWGGALPYLVPVGSEWDSSAPHFEEETVLAAGTVRKALTGKYPQIVLPEEPAEWFQITDVSASGTVRTVRCGSEVLTGQALRELLSLRSACFAVTARGDRLVFTTKGFGHNVGMSQYGANELARRGTDCAGILAHYYPGTVLAGIP